MFKKGNETVYRRVGNLKRDHDGNVQSPTGYFLEPPIRLPDHTEKVFFHYDGRVFVRVANDVADREMGQVLIANFPNPIGLESTGSNFYQNDYKETSESGRPWTGRPNENDLGHIQQYTLEGPPICPLTDRHI